MCHVEKPKFAVFKRIRRDLRCGTAKPCGFYGNKTRCAMWKSRNLRFLRGYDAMCDVEKPKFAVFKGIRRDLRCGTAKPCGFYGNKTRCAMWKSRNLRFLRGYDAMCDAEPLKFRVFGLGDTLCGVKPPNPCSFLGKERRCVTPETWGFCMRRITVQRCTRSPGPPCSDKALNRHISAVTIINRSFFWYVIILLRTYLYRVS